MVRGFTLSKAETKLRNEAGAPDFLSGGKLDLYAIIHEQVSTKLTRSAWIARLITNFLAWVVRADPIMTFINDRNPGRNFEFVDDVFDYLGASCRFRDRDIANIPASGRVIAIANHPLGGLDGLAILKMFGTVRPDVKIVVNNLLMHLEPLSGLLLPVDNMTNRTARQNFAEIEAALEREEAVIIFPAGEVSRRGWRGVRDGAWQRSFLRFAQKTQSPLLPVFVKGRNSQFFYFASLLNLNFSTLLLPRQLFNKKRKPIDMRVGEMIPYAQIDALSVTKNQKLELLKRHVYRIGRGRKPIFKTERNVIAPQNRQKLKQELKGAEVLGQTQDGKKILLMSVGADSVVLSEIGRLREIAFRAVGEGTGKRKDVDNFDLIYRHIILWDDEDLEIAGAYRIGESWRWAAGDDASEARIVEQLYSATLFDYADGAEDIFAQGMELGRSFVQPRYWGLRALDYLWQGIGAYIAANPQLRYLYGPVTISGAYPDAAKDMLVWYYGHYFADPDRLVTGRMPYRQRTETAMTDVFVGDDRKVDFEALRDQLSFFNLSVPTLVKQYSELTEPGGMRFCAFNIDPDFNFCIDGLIIVDIEMVKPSKRKRYVESAWKQHAARATAAEKPQDRVAP